jgi:hypothetical protein
MVVPMMTVMEPREEDLALQVLQDAPKSNSTPQCLATVPTGDILREHGPSLGKTPDPGGDLEPVILTSSRIPQRERTFD